MHCLVSQYKKGGVRGAEAGNHPKGWGWRGGGTLTNKVQVTSQCQCRPFRGRRSHISDTKMLQAVSCVNAGVIATGRKRVQVFNLDRRGQCVTYIKPHLLYMLNVALFHLVMDVFLLGDCTLNTCIWMGASELFLSAYIVLCKELVYMLSVYYITHVASPAEPDQIYTQAMFYQVLLFKSFIFVAYLWSHYFGLTRCCLTVCYKSPQWARTVMARLSEQSYIFSKRTNMLPLPCLLGTERRCCCFVLKEAHMG